MGEQQVTADDFVIIYANHLEDKYKITLDSDDHLMLHSELASANQRAEDAERNHDKYVDRIVEELDRMKGYCEKAQELLRLLAQARNKPTLKNMIVTLEAELSDHVGRCKRCDLK